MNIKESLARKTSGKLKALLRIGFQTYRKVILILPIKCFKIGKSMDTKDYEKWYYGRPQAKEYLNNERIWINLVDMIRYFKPKRVFEFGSGLGNVLKECKKRGIDIVGSETSRYAIQNSLCKENLMHIGEIPKSRLPFRDSSFDLIFSSEVMEHVKEEYTEAVIRELNRICSGYALLTINTFDYNQPGHINMHSRNWWLKNFEKNGLRHYNDAWGDLNKIKYLQWDIYVFKKGNHMEAEKNDTDSIKFGRLGHTLYNIGVSNYDIRLFSCLLLH
jgi:SAM-dependent methyltransferase